jgi:hypothetical protein
MKVRRQSMHFFLHCQILIGAIYCVILAIAFFWLVSGALLFCGSTVGRTSPQRNRTDEGEGIRDSFVIRILKNRCDDRHLAISGPFNIWFTMGYTDRPPNVYFVAFLLSSAVSY